MKFVSIILFSYLADHIPLKQGLRPIRQLESYVDEICLADHIPLKQGLRLRRRNSPHFSCNRARRPYSIKTRIKTIYVDLVRVNDRGLADHIPLKQGLRLKTSLYERSQISCPSQTIFH